MITVRSEAELQRAIVTLLRQAARGDVIWFHVPNGEARSRITGARLKALGVRAGVADLAFVLPGGQAAFLELKRGPGGRLHRYQHAFQNACQRAGALHAVARDIDEAIAVLGSWGVLTLTRPAVAGRGAEPGGAEAPPALHRDETGLPA